MNLKVVIEEGGVRGQDLIYCYIVIMSDYPPLFLAYFMAFFQRSAPMEINSISTLISNVRTSPGSTHGDNTCKYMKLQDVVEVASLESRCHALAASLSNCPRNFGWQQHIPGFKWTWKVLRCLLVFVPMLMLPFHLRRSRLAHRHA